MGPLDGDAIVEHSQEPPNPENSLNQKIKPVVLLNDDQPPVKGSARIE
jgi:hypothetical protein